MVLSCFSAPLITLALSLLPLAFLIQRHILSNVIMSPTLTKSDHAALKAKTGMESRTRWKWHGDSEWQWTGLSRYCLLSVEGQIELFFFISTLEVSQCTLFTMHPALLTVLPCSPFIMLWLWMYDRYTISVFSFPPFVFFNSAVTVKGTKQFWAVKSFWCFFFSFRKVLLRYHLKLGAGAAQTWHVICSKESPILNVISGSLAGRRSRGRPCLVAGCWSASSCFSRDKYCWANPD